MLKVAIVAYPILADDDSRWIEGIRASHDPLAKLVAAHFTFVFPTEVDASPIVEHAATVLVASRPIAFVLRHVRAVRDLTGHGGHVFLVPEEGADEITVLHDRLYGGFLAAHLRADIPFIPHVTVAAYDDFAACERLADSLKQEPRAIAGQINRVEVVELHGDDERVVARLKLGPSGSP